MYWKDNMYSYLISVHKMLKVVIVDISFVLKRVVDGVKTIKPIKYWDDEESKKASYHLKVRNILISTLSANVYDSILHCNTTQTI